MHTTVRTALFLLAFFCLAAAPVAAQTPGLYTGKTSQGYPMGLTVVDIDGQLVIQNWGFSFDLHCQTSSQIVNVGMSFFGFDVPVKNGKFQFQFESLTFTFAMKGMSFLEVGFIGNVSTNWAAIVPKRVLVELCMSSLPGESKVWWAAVPDTAGPSPSFGLSSGENDISISLTRDPQTGHVSEVLTR